MSYRCDSCNEIRQGKELVRVSEIREVNYNRCFTRINRRDRKKENVFDTSFSGTEIVSTQKLCEKCFDEMKDVPPAVSDKVKNIEFIGTKPRRTYDSNNYDSNNDSLDLNGLKNKFEKGR